MTYSPVGMQGVAREKMKPLAAYAPMWLLVIYVPITFAIFVASPLSGEVSNWFDLVLFLTSSVFAFVIGFSVASTVFKHSLKAFGPREVVDTFKRDRRLILLSIVWYLLFSALSLISFGVTSPAGLVAAILDPRGSYYAKFDSIAEGPISAGPFQLLNIAGALYFLLIPLAAMHWKRLSRLIRVGVYTAVLAYLSFFLAIGTQKGVGDILIALTSVLLAISIARPSEAMRRRTVWIAVAALVVGTALVLVIINSFGERTDNTSSLLQTGASRTVDQLSPVFGPDFARGLVVAGSYASHGYLGLSYSLQLPFEWAGGLGAYRGLSSYLPQYFGVSDPYWKTYPVRLEQAHPWSATEVWSTVYPWLASDLTFPGVVIAMLLLGIVVASVWLQFLSERSSLALVLMVLFAIFVVYSPANNQLFNDRYSAIGVITLIFMYLAVRFKDRTHGHDFGGPQHSVGRASSPGKAERIKGAES